MPTKTAGGNSCALCWYRWNRDGEGHCYMFKEEPPNCAKLKVVSNFCGRLYEIVDRNTVIAFDGEGVK